MSKGRTISHRPHLYEMATEFWKAKLTLMSPTDALAALLSKVFALGVIDGRDSTKTVGNGDAYRRGFEDGRKHETAGIGKKNTPPDS